MPPRAPRSPWQNAYVERLIGSVRRECLGHVTVFDDTGLRRILKSYYYENFRTHLSLNKHASVGRAVEPPAHGRLIEIPQVGGLHHHYTRRLTERRRYSKRLLRMSSVGLCPSGLIRFDLSVSRLCPLRIAPGRSQLREDVVPRCLSADSVFGRHNHSPWGGRTLTVR